MLNIFIDWTSCQDKRVSIVLMKDRENRLHNVPVHDLINLIWNNRAHMTVVERACDMRLKHFIQKKSDGTSCWYDYQHEYQVDSDHAANLFHQIDNFSVYSEVISC